MVCKKGTDLASGKERSPAKPALPITRKLQIRMRAVGNMRPVKHGDVEEPTPTSRKRLYPAFRLHDCGQSSRFDRITACVCESDNASELLQMGSYSWRGK